MSTLHEDKYPGSDILIFIQSPWLILLFWRAYSTALGSSLLILG